MLRKEKIFLSDSADDGIVTSRQYSNEIKVEFCGNETEKPFPKAILSSKFGIINIA